MSEKKEIPQYDFAKIEKKWQKFWQEKKTNEPDLDEVKKPFYNLMMFPYPSAEGLHVGNMYAFTGADTFGRFKRLQGYDVFEPIGLDGFGIHSENYAIKIKEHIKTVSDRSEKRFYKQLYDIGNMYDWSRTVETYKPEYYKWTQWLFLQMYKKGLAYRKKAKVNWCPSCKTVLSDEQVIGGKCERCDSEVSKKELNQWFFAITKYADKLLKNLDWIDWPEDVKQNQRNWIGKSIGAEIKFPIQCSRIDAEETQMNVNKNSTSYKLQATSYLDVFTTRPDTLFGATYMVVAPEHPLISNLSDGGEFQISNLSEVEEYVKKALGKSEQERKAEEKEKTGVELKGIKAINPANGKEIPIFVADYVLAGYGTGAIMAVPAHDERDFEFAKKYDLPIRQVVAPLFTMYNLSEEDLKEEKDFKRRKIVFGIVRNTKNDKYLLIKWKDYDDMYTWIAGGIESDEELEEAGRREILEETGYFDLEYVGKVGGEVHKRFLAQHKNEKQYAFVNCVLFNLKTEKRKEIGQNELKVQEPLWIEKKEVSKFLTLGSHKYFWDIICQGEKAFFGEGVAINSDFLDGLKTAEAKKEVVKWLEKNNLGKKAVDYKLRDWCISRQRYWGPPIPIIYCEKCGIVPVDEKDLPVKLPAMEDFLPEGKGKGPLAKNEKFVKTKCPVCGGLAERETDVSDPFVDSSWYFLRYPSTEFHDKPFDKKRTKKWLPADSYIGGKEHTVLHLLYSRFVTMVLNDLGYLDFEEPYKRFFGHGLITKDGAKMSKSKGNVINPDEMIEKYGTDTTRLYLRFLGDFSQGGDWRDSGAAGMHRFVKKVWNIFHELGEADGEGINNMSMIDKTVKVVGEDIEKLSFNTAVARIMEFVNWIRENQKDFSPKQVKKIRQTLALILAPMAPHIAEEFWSKMRINAEKTRINADGSIFDERWQEYDPKKIIDDEIEIAVQVNGKMRDAIKISKDAKKEEIEKLVFESEKIKKRIGSEEIKKIIYVPQRVINIVI